MSSVLIHRCIMIPKPVFLVKVHIEVPMVRVACAGSQGAGRRRGTHTARPKCPFECENAVQAIMSDSVSHADMHHSISPLNKMPNDTHDSQSTLD